MVEVLHSSHCITEHMFLNVWTSTVVSFWVKENVICINSEYNKMKVYLRQKRQTYFYKIDFVVTHFETDENNEIVLHEHDDCVVCMFPSVPTQV